MKMEKINCFAYISKLRCAGLTHKKCDKCKFYKSKEEYNRGMKQAMQYCKDNNIHTYDDFFFFFQKRKGGENG